MFVAPRLPGGGQGDIRLHQAGISPRSGWRTVWTWRRRSRTCPVASTCNVTNLPYFANTPAIQTMNAAFDKYYPGMRSSPLYNEGNASHVGLPVCCSRTRPRREGWARTAPRPRRPSWSRDWSRCRVTPWTALAPPLTFTAGQPHPVDCWFEALMKNGKASLPIGTQTVCEK